MHYHHINAWFKYLVKWAESYFLKLETSGKKDFLKTGPTENKRGQWRITQRKNKERAKE
jgi:hypothetical protein